MHIRSAYRQVSDNKLRQTNAAASAVSAERLQAASSAEGVSAYSSCTGCSCCTAKAQLHPLRFRDCLVPLCQAARGHVLHSKMSSQSSLSNRHTSRRAMAMVMDLKRQQPHKLHRRSFAQEEGITYAGWEVALVLDDGTICIRHIHLRRCQFWLLVGWKVGSKLLQTWLTPALAWQPQNNITELPILGQPKSLVQCCILQRTLTTSRTSISYWFRLARVPCQLPEGEHS